MKIGPKGKEIPLEEFKKRMAESDPPGGLLCCPPSYLAHKDDNENADQDEEYYVVYHAIYQTKDINKARWHVASFCETPGMETMIKRKKVDGLTEFYGNCAED